MIPGAQTQSDVPVTDYLSHQVRTLQGAERGNPIGAIQDNILPRTISQRDDHRGVAEDARLPDAIGKRRGALFVIPLVNQQIIERQDRQMGLLNLPNDPS
jgi:hypothetical protein